MRAFALAFAALAGCHSTAGDPVPALPGSEPPKSALAYPSENIGTSVGNVIPNFCFSGFVDAVQAQDEKPICLGHFYNPSGTGAFGASDPFDDGAPLPKVLVVDVSGSWCQPCKQEAKSVLPVKYADLHPRGLMILLVLADGLKPGEVATLGDLASWTSTFGAEYPSVIDPGRQMGALFDSNSLPANFIIDAKTMKIIDLYPAKPPESFWQKVESLL